MGGVAGKKMCKSIRERWRREDRNRIKADGGKTAIKVE